MTKVVYVSDFDAGGSGYSNIGMQLCDGLVERGHEVTALGLHFRGQEHDHPYPIVPTEFPDIPHMVTQLGAYRRLDVLVVALDIPHLEKLMDRLHIPSDGRPFIGVFPIESPPMCQTWMLSTMRMTRRLVMSKFGVDILERSGVESTFIPIGVDSDSWRPPTVEERLTIRESLGIDDGSFVVLTVADNQERKNLSGAMEMIARARESCSREIYWYLVTRPHSPVGWKLDDLAMELGILPWVQTWQRGLSFKQLWSLFAAADCFLLTSKAEGLAMPLLEAMSSRLLCVATNGAAMREHLDDGEARGVLLPVEFTTRDPWGNGERYFVSIEKGARILATLPTIDEPKRQRLIDAAQAYTQDRPWSASVEVLHEAVQPFDGGGWSNGQKA